MVIWLASYPRSGNAFVRIALSSLFQFESRSVYPENTGYASLDDDGSSRQICAAFLWRSSYLGPRRFGLVRRLLGFGDCMKGDGAGAAPKPVFVKTHEVPFGVDGPAIYLIRDGRDALVSYAHFILEVEHGIPVGSNREAFLSVLRELITSHRRFGGWSANASAWSERTEPTAIVRFENLVANPATVLQAALTEVGLFSKADGAAPSFEDLHRTSPRLFRRGKIGGWRDEMPEALHDLFWQHHHRTMTAFHYPR